MPSGAGMGYDRSRWTRSMLGWRRIARSGPAAWMLWNDTWRKTRNERNPGDHRRPPCAAVRTEPRASDRAGLASHHRAHRARTLVSCCRRLDARSGRDLRGGRTNRAGHGTGTTASDRMDLRRAAVSVRAARPGPGVLTDVHACLRRPRHRSPDGGWLGMLL